MGEAEADYRADRRLLLFRIDQLEEQARELMAFRAAQLELTAKTKQDVDAAHQKLRLIVTRERYKAFTAIATAVTAAVAAIAAYFKRA